MFMRYSAVSWHPHIICRLLHTDMFMYKEMKNGGCTDYRCDIYIYTVFKK